MLFSNGDIRRLGCFGIVAIVALLAFGPPYGFAGLLVALPASAMLLLPLLKFGTRYLECVLCPGRK